MSIVGIIVNPNAGKDIRRLVTPATHTSDGTKVGIVRRAIVAAFESGATKVLLMPDGQVDYFSHDWLELVSLA